MSTKKEKGEADRREQPRKSSFLVQGSEMSKSRNHGGISERTAWKRLLLLGLGGLLAWWLFSTIRESAKRDDYVAVDLNGMQHIGPDFNVAQFYMDRTNGFNVGREGGGGSDVCCVLLPSQWRPGLSVDLRWSVGNWTKANRAEMDKNNYKSITFENFRARVPLERYETPGRVRVHFFAGGKARVMVMGSPGLDALNGEFFPEDSSLAQSATVGTRVDDLFTQQEKDEADRRERERKSTFFGGGDWR